MMMLETLTKMLWWHRLVEPRKQASVVYTTSNAFSTPILRIRMRAKHPKRRADERRTHHAENLLATPPSNKLALLVNKCQGRLHLRHRLHHLHTLQSHCLDRPKEAGCERSRAVQQRIRKTCYLSSSRLFPVVVLPVLLHRHLQRLHLRLLRLLRFAIRVHGTKAITSRRPRNRNHVNLYRPFR